MGLLSFLTNEKVKAKLRFVYVGLCETKGMLAKQRNSSLSLEKERVGIILRIDETTNILLGKSGLSS